MKPTLWTTLDRERYFIIVDDHIPSEGKEILQSLSGEQIQVDLESLTTFEVSEEEANEFLQGQLREVLKEMKHQLLNYKGGASAGNTANPGDKIFQAELVDGAAGFIAQLSQGLVNHMQKTAEGLREEALQTAAAAIPQQEIGT